MRGKVPDCFEVRLNRRITPAYAGKSMRIQILSFGTRDHPRLCGEKVPRLTYLANNQGSPPPMRGKAVSRRSFNFS